MADNNYKIAQITQAEEKAIKKAEADENYKVKY